MAGLVSSGGIGSKGDTSSASTVHTEAINIDDSSRVENTGTVNKNVKVEHNKYKAKTVNVTQGDQGLTDALLSFGSQMINKTGTLQGEALQIASEANLNASRNAESENTGNFQKYFFVAIIIGLIAFSIKGAK